jgi:hypothetical protein
LASETTGSRCSKYFSKRLVAFGFFAALRDHLPLLAQLAPHQLAQLERFREALDQDVGGAADRRLRVRKALLLVPEGERPELEGLSGLRGLGAVAATPDPVGEGLEAGVARYRGAALPLPLVGEVEILERVAIEGREDALAQLRRELLLAIDLLDDERLAREDRVPLLARRRARRGSPPRRGCRCAPCGSAR